MIKKLIIVLFIALFSSLAVAIRLIITKTVIDIFVVKKFPKEKLTILLDKPTTKYSKERQKIELFICTSLEGFYSTINCANTNLH